MRSTLVNQHVVLAGDFNFPGWDWHNKTIMSDSIQIINGYECNVAEYFMS